MTITKEIASTIAETYSGTPWYGPSVKEKLGSISYLQAIVRYAPGKKNIAEFVSHILAWRTFVIERLEGNFDYKVGINSERDWPRIDELDEAGWTDLLNRLDDSQQRLVELITLLPDEKLKEKMPNTGDYSFTYGNMLHGIYQHDVYHLGQISLVLGLVSPGEEQ